MPQKFKSDTPTLEEIKRLKKPNKVTVPIVLDPDLKHQVQEKHKEIEAAKRKRGERGDLASGGVSKLEAELAELEEALDDVAVDFVFQDIGRKNYDNLVQAHPATDEQKADYRRQAEELEMDIAKIGGLSYNPDTFPPALMAACAISPKLTIEEATEIFNEWSEGDVEMLFMGAMQACKERVSVGFSRPATEKTEDSDSNSTTALNGE